MEPRSRLEANLASESEAYGYTLSIWGSGALTIHVFGVPGVWQTMAFVAGALAAFGSLAVVAFQGISAEAAASESPSSLVVSTVHIVATGGTLLCAHLLLALAKGGPALLAFFGVGALATLAYNLLLLIEALSFRSVF